MNLKKKFVIGAASLALVAGMGVAPAMADPAMDPSEAYDINQLRVAGADRVETSIKVAAHQYDKSNGVTPIGTIPSPVAYIAGYDGTVDSAVAGALQDGPIFFAKKDGSSNEKLGDAIKKYGVTKVIALGGTASVPDEVLKGIAEKSGGLDTERLDGKDRYETSVAVAKRWSQVNSLFTPPRVILANGATLVDALTAGTFDAPILLVEANGNIPASVMGYLKSVKPQNFIAVGGTAAVPDSTVLTAQYTALSDQTLSTDDNLADIQAKMGVWCTRARDGGALDEQAKTSKALADAAALEVKQTKLELQKKMNVFNQALVAAYAGDDGLAKPNATDTLFEGKYVADATDFADVNTAWKDVAKLLDGNHTGTGLYSEEGTDVPAAVTKESVDKYVNFTVKGATLNEAELEKLLDTPKKDAKTAIDKYNADGTAPDAGTLALAVTGSAPNVNDAVAPSAAHFPQLAEEYAYGYRAQLAASNFQSAKDTCLFLQQKEANMQDLVRGKTYLRLGGADRYATAGAIAAWQITNGWYQGQQAVLNYYLANGESFADATVAGTIGDGPVLLVKPDGTIPSSTDKEIIRGSKAVPIAQHRVQVYGIGGTKVVSDATLKTANATALVAQKDAAPTPVAAFTLTAGSDALSAGAGAGDTATVTVSRALVAGETVNATVAKKSGNGNNAPTATHAGTTVTVHGDGTNAFVAGAVYTVTVTISAPGKSSVTQTIDLTVGS